MKGGRGGKGKGREGMWRVSSFVDGKELKVSELRLPSFFESYTRYAL